MNAGNMDLTTMLSSQIITMTGMKDGNIMHAIYGIIALTIFNKLVAAVPEIWKALCGVITFYFSQKKNEFVNKTIATVVKKRVGTIKFEKLVDGADSVVIIALINYISGIKSSKHLVYNNDYFVVNTEEFLLKPDVFCKVMSFSKDDKGKITGYNFEIYSYVYDIEYLKEFVNNIKKEYEQERSNNLGKQPYFFNEIPFNVPREMTGGYRLEAAPKQINFEMTPFFTNKSLANVFGSHLDVVKKRVDMFINNPRWYEEKGIPYTLGILLSGPPGTGKTSLIKAIAKDTKRHIFNINLRQTTTQSQLRNLFYDTEIRILRNGRSEIINIPLEKRIYVIEDIDCLSDVVIDRSIKAGSYGVGSPDPVHSDNQIDKGNELDITSSNTGSNTNTPDTSPSRTPPNNNTGSPSSKPLKSDTGSPSSKPLKSDTGSPSRQSSQKQPTSSSMSPIGSTDIKSILGNPDKSNTQEDPNYVQSSFLDEQFAEQLAPNMKGINTGMGNTRTMMQGDVNDSKGKNDDSMLPGIGAFNSFGGSFSGFEELTGPLQNIQDTSATNNNTTFRTTSNNNKTGVQNTTSVPSFTNKVEMPVYNQSDILKDINPVTKTAQQQIPKQQYATTNANAHPEELNLSFLLNLLDGVLETPGRILIVTSNYPERLDRALIRPGRIDINLNVGYCSRNMIIDMCRFFYDDKSINIPESEWVYDDENITPAEMHKILLNNFDNFRGCLAELKKQN